MGVGGVVRVWDTPTIQLKVGKSLKRQMDAAAAYWLLRQAKELWGSVYVVLEKVVPMPSTHAGDAGAKMGASSAFGFGKGVGIWIGIMTALEIPFEEVHPATWKKVMMPGMGREKGASVLKATQLFPSIAREITRVKDHGRAEALLLAEYGRKSREMTATAGLNFHGELKDIESVLF
jgi:hypothetical protein